MNLVGTRPYPDVHGPDACAMRMDSTHEPEGRARHSVRAAAWQGQNGAQGTDASYRTNWFMATMCDFEIVEATHEPGRDVFYCVRALMREIPDAVERVSTRIGLQLSFQ